MTDAILKALYNAPECDHETLLQAFFAYFAYFAEQMDDDEYYFWLDELNPLTNMVWHIETTEHRFD